MRGKLFLVLLVLAFSLSSVSATETDSLRSRPLGQRLSGAALSLAMNAGVTEGLKASIHEMRPDRSGNNSFPSRHTSWSFAAASVIAHEGAAVSPWFVLVPQAAASAVGFQRVYERRHYASDVFAGAAIGVASTELGYWLAGLLFGNKLQYPSAKNIFRCQLEVFTEAIWNFDNVFYCGYGSGLRGVIPVSERWGINIASCGYTTPWKKTALQKPLTSFSVTGGATYRILNPVESLALEGRAGIGFMHFWHNAFGKSNSFVGEAGVSASWQFTPGLALKATAGAKVYSVESSLYRAAITFSLGSVAVF